MLEYYGVSGIDDRILLIPLASEINVGWQHVPMEDTDGLIHDILIYVSCKEELRKGFSTKYIGEALYKGCIYNFEARIKKNEKEFVLIDQHEDWQIPPDN